MPASGLLPPTLLLALLLLATRSDGAEAKPAPWLAFASNKNRLSRIKCTVCIAVMEDVSSHLEALHTIRGAGEGDAQVLAMFDNLCEDAEKSFWALKWSKEGPVGDGFVKRYDIEVAERAAAQALRELSMEGSELDSSFFGTDEQKEWAKGFYLRHCRATLKKLPLVALYKTKQDPAYPLHCPYKYCKADKPLFAHKAGPDASVSGAKVVPHHSGL